MRATARADWRPGARTCATSVCCCTRRSACAPRAARAWLDDVRIDGAAQDVRFAVRLLRKHPTSSAIAIVGLAVAIAVAVSVFTIVDAVMLRPYGMDDPSSVVSVGEPRHGWPFWPYSSFVKIQEAATLARIEASMSPKVRFSTIADAGNREQAPGVLRQRRLSDDARRTAGAGPAAWPSRRRGRRAAGDHGQPSTLVHGAERGSRARSAERCG